MLTATRVESLPKLYDRLGNIKIKNPIVQHINGTGGAYRLQNIEKQRSYNIADWRWLSEESEHQPPAKRGERRKTHKKIKKAKTDAGQTCDGLRKQNSNLEGFDYTLDDNEFSRARCEDLERTYWKTLTYNSPLYGADMPGSLFDDSTEVWNVSKLENILNNLSVKIPGVNSSYLYCGMWKSTFSWHLEDMDLYSINYIHFGAPKQWYSISQNDRAKFFNIMREIWPEEHKNCKEFLRHKLFHASPSLLQQWGIKVNKLVHYQNEFVITFPYGYHSGFNYGYNCAESVNFATENWIPFGKEAGKCMCISDSVGIDVEQLASELKVSIDDQKSNSKKRKLGPRQEISVIKKKKLSFADDSCSLCPNLYELEFLPCDNHAKVHRVCAHLIPGISVITRGDGTEYAKGLKKVLDSPQPFKCVHCGSKKGKCFKCSEQKCSRTFHATCAASAGVFVKTEIDPHEPTKYFCRFHRPKKHVEKNLEEDIKFNNWAYTLLPGDVVQCQVGSNPIFAGVVEENSLSENSVIVKVLPSCLDMIEIEWKYIIAPAQFYSESFELPKSAIKGSPYKEPDHSYQYKSNDDFSICREASISQISSENRPIKEHVTAKKKLPSFIGSAGVRDKWGRMIFSGIKDDRVAEILQKDETSDSVWALECLSGYFQMPCSCDMFQQCYFYQPSISTMSTGHFVNVRVT